jgi:hypothetical protein
MNLDKDMNKSINKSIKSNIAKKFDIMHYFRTFGEKESGLKKEPEDRPI